MTTNRDLGKELLESIADIKAGRGLRRATAMPVKVSGLRHSLSLTQLEMSAILGVSIRTLQEWEQERRKPSGAAESLLHIMESHPEIFCSLNR
jgi:putative transcriptional regulator